MSEILGFDADVDCSDVVAEAKSKGAVFVARYLKNLTFAEAQAISAAGLKIISIFETTAQRALGGIAAGRVDGAKARFMAAKLRQPAGSVLCATADFDVIGDQHETVLDYFTGFKSAAPDMKLMVYANGAVCQAALAAKIADFTWVCDNRWIGSQAFIRAGKATIVQDVGDKRGLDLGIDLDSDVASTEEFGGWSVAASAVARSGDADAFVRAFQADRGLGVDGDPGPLTWAALDALRT